MHRSQEILDCLVALAFWGSVLCCRMIFDDRGLGASRHCDSVACFPIEEWILFVIWDRNEPCARHKIVINLVYSIPISGYSEEVPDP